VGNIEITTKPHEPSGSKPLDTSLPSPISVEFAPVPRPANDPRGQRPATTTDTATNDVEEKNEGAA
jgi:hypothetical protein